MACAKLNKITNIKKVPKLNQISTN